MKIFGNIRYLFKAVNNLKYLNEYKKEIIDARAKGDLEREKKNILLATSHWGKNFSKDLGWTIDLTGQENLPSEGPVVYVPNHQGYGDIIVLCAVLDTVQTGFVAKSSLEKVPLYGEWIKLIRSVLIERDNVRESVKAISRGMSLIEQGFSLVIFPEGTRSQGPEMGDFKRGAFKLATKPGVPIIPVTVNGTWKAFEKEGRVRPASIQVHIHPAIKTDGLNKQEEKELADRIKDLIQAKLDEFLGKSL